MEQDALGAAGVRGVWAGAGLQRTAYRGGHIAWLPAQLKLNYIRVGALTPRRFFNTNYAW